MGLETWNIWESWAGNVISAKKKKSLFLQEAVFYAKMAFFFFFCSVVLLMGVEYFLWILASAGLWCSVASTEKDLVVH